MLRAIDKERCMNGRSIPRARLRVRRELVTGTSHGTTLRDTTISVWYQPRYQLRDTTSGDWYWAQYQLRYSTASNRYQPPYRCTITRWAAWAVYWRLRVLGVT